MSELCSVAKISTKYVNKEFHGITMTNLYATNNPSSIFSTATGKAPDVGWCLPQKLRTSRPSLQHHSPKSQEVSIRIYYVPSGSPDKGNSILFPQTSSLLGISCGWLSGTPKMSFWMKRASQGKKWVTFMWRGRSTLSCNTYKWMTFRMSWECLDRGFQSWFGSAKSMHTRGSKIVLTPEVQLLRWEATEKIVS